MNGFRYLLRTLMVGGVFQGPLGIQFVHLVVNVGIVVPAEVGWVHSVWPTLFD